MHTAYFETIIIHHTLKANVNGISASLLLPTFSLLLRRNTLNATAHKIERQDLLFPIKLKPGSKPYLVLQVGHGHVSVGASCVDNRRGGHCGGFMLMRIVLAA